MSFMYENSLVEDLLQEMLEASRKIAQRCARASCVDDFMTEEGQITLDSICMQLIAIGEAVKKVDSLTDRKLFVHYPQINWKAIAAMRDILSHHYFDLNAETVYGVCQEEITPLMKTLEEMIKKG
ncbi:MAG: DUF86 domain-containing protein [Sulfurovum sp.]|nr:DUF86 domain-containing protein [Sulfurovum sp.]